MDTWLLTVTRGVPGGRDFTSDIRVSLLWTCNHSPLSLLEQLWELQITLYSIPLEQTSPPQSSPQKELMVFHRRQTWLELKTVPYNFAIEPTVDKMTRRGIPPKWVDFAASGIVVRVRDPNVRLVRHPITCTRKTAFILTNSHIYLHSRLSLWVPDVSGNYIHSRDNWNLPCSMATRGLWNHTVCQ